MRQNRKRSSGTAGIAGYSGCPLGNTTPSNKPHKEVGGALNSVVTWETSKSVKNVKSVEISLLYDNTPPIRSDSGTAVTHGFGSKKSGAIKTSAIGA